MTDTTEDIGTILPCCLAILCAVSWSAASPLISIMDLEIAWQRGKLASKNKASHAHSQRPITDRGPHSLIHRPQVRVVRCCAVRLIHPRSFVHRPHMRHGRRCPCHAHACEQSSRLNACRMPQPGGDASTCTSRESSRHVQTLRQLAVPRASACPTNFMRCPGSMLTASATCHVKSRQVRRAPPQGPPCSTAPTSVKSSQVKSGARLRKALLAQPPPQV